MPKKASNKKKTTKKKKVVRKKAAVKKVAVQPPVINKHWFKWHGGVRGTVDWKKELVKQLIDQPLHVLMGIASVCALAFVSQNVWVAVGLTFAWEAYREFWQWPSSRWWDPPLDFFFEAVGIVAGYFVAVRWVL